ncbi:hypothetical protein ACROYT_G002840 [Oculina patagonica]
MRKFFSEVIGHVRSVESLGEKLFSETLAPFLVPLIVDKLLKEIVKRWKIELNEEKAKQGCVEVKTLFTFLKQLIRAKESSQPPSLDFKAPAKENPGNRENRFKFYRSQKSSTFALCAATQKIKCVICYKNHDLKSASPSLEEVKVELAPELPSRPVVSSSSVVTKFVAVSSGGKVILQTVPTTLCGSKGCSKVVRCFFDPGSQTSIVRNSVIDELDLNGKSVKTAVSGFGVEATKSTFTVAPIDKSGQPQCIEALTTPVISLPAVAVHIHPTRWSHLRNKAFPEEFPREEQKIDVLIGFDFYFSL